MQCLLQGNWNKDCFEEKTKIDLNQKRMAQPLSKIVYYDGSFNWSPVGFDFLANKSSLHTKHSKALWCSLSRLWIASNYRMKPQ